MKSYRQASCALALFLATLTACGTPPTPLAAQPTMTVALTTTAQPTMTIAPTTSTAQPTTAASPGGSGDQGSNPCGGPPSKGNFEQRAGQNGEFCVVWQDTFTDETGYRMTLAYGDRERFVYDAPANSTHFVVPAADTPKPGNCARSSFSLKLEAVQPSGVTLVNGMAMDTECY